MYSGSREQNEGVCAGYGPQWTEMALGTGWYWAPPSLAKEQLKGL